MLRVTVRTLGQLAFVLFGVSIVVFGLTRLTGDPTALLLAPDASDADRQAFRAAYGLDRPLPEQYVAFVGRAAHADLGKSLAFGSPAIELLVQRLPATVELSVAALAIVVVIGVPAGMIAAVTRGRIVDRAVMLFAVLGQSMATFWLGIMLILAFAVSWPLFPPSGRGSLRHLVLPAFTLAMYLTAVIARLTRSGMLEVLGEDFVRTARAKGVSETAVIVRHAFTNTLIPIVTVLGVQIGNLLAGAVVTEAVFAWPGVGSLTVEAIYRRDYPLIQAAVLFFAFVYTCINLATEWLYGYLDPRVRVA